MKTNDKSINNDSYVLSMYSPDHNGKRSSAVLLLWLPQAKVTCVGDLLCCRLTSLG